MTTREWAMPLRFAELGRLSRTLDTIAEYESINPLHGRKKTKEQHANVLTFQLYSVP